MKYNFIRFKEIFINRLRNWRNRGQTLLGKILIVNTLLISQLVYKMIMVCSMSDAQYRELKAIILDYLWSGKKPKIAYKKLIQSYENGGLKLHDIAVKDKSLKLSWVSKFLSNTFWFEFIQTFFDIPLKLLFRANISPKHVIKLHIISPILRQVLLY